MANEEQGTQQTDTVDAEIMPSTEEILALVEQQGGGSDADGGATETDGDAEQEESQAVTEDEPTDGDDSNGDVEDSGGDEGESGDEQGGVRDEGGGDSDAKEFYSAEELENIPPNQIDIDRVRPGLKGYVRNLKKKYDAADGKFRDAAEERKANEAILKLIEEQRKQAEQQREWREEDRRQQQEAEQRRRMDKRYEQLLESYDPDTASKLLRAEFGQQQSPQQSGVNPEWVQQIDALKNEVEQLRIDRNSRILGELIDGAISNLGVPDSAKKDVFDRTHKEVFSQWNDDAAQGRAQTPIEDIVARVVFKREKEAESYRKQLLSDEELRKQIASEERKKIYAELKKKKSGGEKTVIKPGKGSKADAEADGGKITFDDSHSDGIWQGLEIPEDMMKKFQDGVI